MRFSASGVHFCLGIAASRKNFSGRHFDEGTKTAHTSHAHTKAGLGGSGAPRTPGDQVEHVAGGADCGPTLARSVVSLEWIRGTVGKVCSGVQARGWFTGIILEVSAPCPLMHVKILPCLPTGTNSVRLF